MPNIRAQALIFVIFATVNGSLFLLATYNFNYSGGGGLAKLHPTFSNAPDTHRYGGVAESLANDTGFHYLNDSTGELHPLVRGGPLPSIMFFAPVKFLGTTAAAGAIVFIQCFLLYLIALVFRTIGHAFKTHPTITQILILFNPILIISAHHAQSEIIFVFFLALFLATGISLICSKTPKFAVWGLLGVFSGCMYLARPSSVFLIFAMTAVVPVLAFPIKAAGHNQLRRALFQLGTFFLVGLLTASPWLVRNANLESMKGLFLPNAITSINDNLIELLFYGQQTGNWLRYSDLDKSAGFLIVSTQLLKIDPNAVGCLAVEKSHTHFQGLKSVGFLDGTETCMNLVERALINSILEQGIGAWIRAGTRAVLVTVFAGGGLGLNSYLGLDAIGSSSTSSRTDALYLLLFSLNIILHLFAITGLIIYLRNSPKDKRNFLLLATLLLSFASYGFIGNARFRAPLDPIFMLYASYAFGLLIQKYRRFRS